MPDEQKQSVEKIQDLERLKSTEKVEIGVDQAMEKKERPDVAVEKEQVDLEKYRLPVEKAGEAVSATDLPASNNIQRQHQRRLKEIEKIMSEDLSGYFLQMDQQKQQEFRTIGEKTAQEINVLLDKAKINLKKIVNLLKRWLLIIPGVNRFFLEQEAKIKADEISKLTRT